MCPRKAQPYAIALKPSVSRSKVCGKRSLKAIRELSSSDFYCAFVHECCLQYRSYGVFFLRVLPRSRGAGQGGHRRRANGAGQPSGRTSRAADGVQRRRRFGGGFRFRVGLFQPHIILSFQRSFNY